jgi:ABC-type glycerol-3-phosphate transport system permease component
MATHEMSAPVEMSATAPRPATGARTDYYHPKRGIKWGPVVRHVVLLFFVVVVLAPLLWVFLLSLKSFPDAVQRYIWPKNFFSPLFGHYSFAWDHVPTLRTNFMNSVMVTAGTIVAATVASVLAGYALVHLHTPAKRIVTALLVASMFFPTRVTALVGLFQVQEKLNLINVTWGLILPYTALSVAISTFIMRGVFETVPTEIIHSAHIDGASSMRTLLEIVLPLVRNGIVVVIIVNFVAAWGEYLLALTLMNDQSHRTLPVVIVNATGGMGAWKWPNVGAVYVMAVIPGLVAFGISQRWYMKGLQEGAIKA